MTTLPSVQTIISAVENLSPEEQSLLLDRLNQRRVIENQSRENIFSTSNTAWVDDPWIKYAGMFSDDPDFDDFLAEIEAYRREIDADMAVCDDRFDEPEVAR